MKVATRSEQRARHAHRIMVSIGLECHLMNLHRDITNGDTTKIVDFQQMIQYAPEEMKERIAKRINLQEEK